MRKFFTNFFRYKCLEKISGTDCVKNEERQEVEEYPTYGEKKEY
jgi:hypothetical protein